LKQSEKVKNVRQTGTILAFDWVTETETSYFNQIQEKLFKVFINKGIILRPMGNVLYLLPPYCIQQEDLEYTYKTILEVLNNNNI
jgi:adenosylmethionine-8-amino-7-oxononanoate aminotransferase